MKRRKKYGNMMEECGNKVKYVEIKHKNIKNEIPAEIINKYKPDLVWFQNISYIKNNVNFIEHIKSKNIPIVVYYTFNPQEAYDREDWIKVWKKIDYFFVHHKEFSKFLKTKNINAYYMPIGFYKDQYYHKTSGKKYNISFCGTDLIRENKNKDKRAIYIRSLKKYNIVVYGKGFRKKVGNIKVYPYRKHDIQREVYSKSKINLDLPFYCTPDKFYDCDKRRYHIKNRFFEIPATRNFLLTIRCSEFLEIFDEDTIGYYDDNIESLQENVKKYLKDENLRKKMAKKAYKLVNEKHTYLHRFKEMFKIIG